MGFCLFSFSITKAQVAHSQPGPPQGAQLVSHPQISEHGPGSDLTWPKVKPAVSYTSHPRVMLLESALITGPHTKMVFSEVHVQGGKKKAPVLGSEVQPAKSRNSK